MRSRFFRTRWCGWWITSTAAVELHFGQVTVRLTSLGQAMGDLRWWCLPLVRRRAPDTYRAGRGTVGAMSLIGGWVAMGADG
jgi:hypothetical protein